MSKIQKTVLAENQEALERNEIMLKFVESLRLAQPENKNLIKRETELLDQITNLKIFIKFLKN